MQQLWKPTVHSGNALTTVVAYDGVIVLVLAVDQTPYLRLCTCYVTAVAEH